MGDDSAMNLELHSERLALTPFAPTDLDLCLKMFTDPEVAEYVGGPMTKAAISKENAASRNVLIKAGFVDHGTMRSYGEDGPIYRITRDEWSKLQHSV